MEPKSSRLTHPFRLALYGMVVLFLFAASGTALAKSSRSKSYRSTLHHVTKRGQLYDDSTWNAKIIWRATLFTDAFRNAYEEKHVDVEHLSSPEADRFVAEQQLLQGAGWEFLVVMYTRSDYKSFTTGPDTFWKCFLTDAAGEKVEPLSIAELPTTPYLQVMFTHINRWSKAYRVIFPKVALGARPELTMQSVVGTSSLAWKLK